eukprot:m.179580 g.179580  ORF g.179580 m.179580 type:complete len:202 (+) comp39223_c1_seq1:2390-2995(+)
MSFGKIASHILAFLLILSDVMLAFSFWATIFYHAGLNTKANYEHFYQGPFPCCKADNYLVCLESAAGNNTLIPPQMAGLPQTILTLLWAVFGLVDMNEFSVYNYLESSLGQLVVTVWITVAVIALVNLLIAIITNTFQNVEDNADAEWKFARARVIRDVQMSPVIPPPINVLQLVATSIAYVLSGKFLERVIAYSVISEMN